MTRRRVVNVVCILVMGAGAVLTVQGFSAPDPEPTPPPVPFVPVPAPRSTPEGPVVSI